MALGDRSQNFLSRMSDDNKMASNAVLHPKTTPTCSPAEAHYGFWQLKSLQTPGEIREEAKETALHSKSLKKRGCPEVTR